VQIIPLDGGADRREVGYPARKERLDEGDVHTVIGSHRTVPCLCAGGCPEGERWLDAIVVTVPSEPALQLLVGSVAAVRPSQMDAIF
jgi:hypothetical protein